MMLIIMFAAAVSPTDGKTMASDSWGTLAISDVAAAEGAGGPLYLKVSGGDLDGDGLPDDAILKLMCADGALGAAAFRLSPRDSATGQVSERRTHKPIKIIKEWDAATPQLRSIKPTYDVKTVKGARLAADAEGWTAITLASSDGLCAAASAAVVKTKTKSNQSND